jgi:hypothetical protein
MSTNTPGCILTFAAGNVFMNALLRSGPSQVTHLYARFGDSGANPGFLSPPDNDLRNCTRTTFIETDPGDTVRGGLWVPVLSAPAQSSTDSEIYTGNQATFFFRIPFNLPTSQQSPSNFDVATSYIYALGLAVATNPSDRSQDVIMAVMQATGFDPDDLLVGSFTPFQIPPSGQESIDFSLPFTVDAV